MKKARLWAYVRGGNGPPLTAYDFSHDRSKQRPLNFLDRYRGYVHADAYGGYDELFHKDGITEVGCWAHARRKFDEATSSRPKEATEIIARIAKIYKVEAECAEMNDSDRREYREQYSKPDLDAIFQRLAELKIASPPSEPLRKAIDYALNQRQALYRYLEDGRLRPDNNLAENAIRPLALGRTGCLQPATEAPVPPRST